MVFNIKTMMNLYSVKVMLVDIILYGIINAGLGGVIAMILGYGKKPATM
jgi:hypothetical protein